MGDWADEMALDLAVAVNAVGNPDGSAVYLTRWLDATEDIAQALRSVRAEALREAVGAIKAEWGKWADTELVALGGQDIVRGAAYVADGATKRIEALIGKSDG